MKLSIKQSIKIPFGLLLVVVFGAVIGCSNFMNDLGPAPLGDLSLGDTLTVASTDGSTEGSMTATVVDSEHDGSIDGLDLDGDSGTVEISLATTEVAGVYACELNGDGTAEFYLTDTANGHGTLNTKIDGSGSALSVVVDSNGNIVGYDSDGDGTVDIQAQGTTVYGVAYYSNSADSGNAPTNDSLYEAGETVSVEGNSGGLTKSGHTFVGWNTAPDGSGTAYYSGDGVTFGTADVALYAQWSIDLGTSANSTRFGFTVIEKNHLGYTGQGFVAQNNNTDSGFAVQAPFEFQAVIFRYSAASNGGTRPSDFLVGVYSDANVTNTGSSSVYTFDTTADWDSWARKTISISGVAGEWVNFIFADDITNYGGMNADYILFVPAD